MELTYDPAKRAATLAERGLDFDDCAQVFEGATFEIEDRRVVRTEQRVICCGRLRGRMVVIVCTLRHDARRIISMRKANAREEARSAPRLGV